MEKLLLSLSNCLRDIKKIYFAVLFLLSSSLGLAQSITTNKTVTANPGNCGIVNVKVDITGANPITRNSDVILAIDISGSMGYTIPGDFKTSMDYAKDAALAFLTQAKANPQNRIAIVAYSTTASLKIGLTYLNPAGVTLITNQINALQATNSTNIYAGIVKSETELETNGRFDCSTARAIILLTDGVTNVTGTNGNTSCNLSKTSQCVTDAISAAANAKTTTKSSVVYNNQLFSVGLFGSISGNINTNNSDQNIAKYTLDGIQGSPSYITQSGANLTSIYNQIATQISWIGQNLITKETVIPGFTIGSITASKGTATLSGQVITWNTDFLNSETITLNYQLTPTGTACGNQVVSTSTLNYQNSSCANDSKTISSPSYFVPCAPVVTGLLTACGSTTLTATTNAASPTYVWYKDNAVLPGETSSTLVATASGVYKVKVKNGVTNCELTSADSTVSISPAAALTAPVTTSIAGCGTAALTGLPYSTASTNITLSQLTTAGGSLPNNSAIGTYTISYSDTATGTCPTVVTRTFKVTTGCGNVTAIQTISITDTTAPTWTTSANALNTTLQCSDAAGLTAAQNQAPVATDNCGGTVTYTKTSGAFTAGSCANSGTYTNTWIAKDVCLNTSTVYTQTITIIDNTVPTWTTSANTLNTTLQCSDAAGLTAAQNQAPVATDNCGGTVTYTKTSGTFTAGTCANSGTYTNTWIAKDVCLNTSTVFTQTITIIDNTVPTWTTSANALNTTLQCSDAAGLTAAQNQAPVATDNCGGTVTYTKTSGAFTAGSCANSGTYNNTWVAKDVCLNTSTVFTQTITIIDNTAPTWTTNATALNTTLQCSDTAGLTAAQNQAPVATDNCGGTVTYTKTSGTFTAGSCANSGTYTNIWIAKDVCMNTSTVFTQTITITDTTAPTWTTSANALNTTLQCNDAAGLTTAQNQAPVATDNCGGTVTYTKTSGTFTAGSCANSGTYTNTWVAKDVCLNTSTVFSQTITIIDNTAPTWSTSANALNTTLQCSDATGLTAAQNQAPVATDNCGGTVTYTKTSGVFTAGSCANSGTYTNTWIAKDVCLNTSTVFTQTITIIDNTAPTWSTSANALNTTLQCSDAAGLTAAQNQAPVATDNCGGTVTYIKTSGTFTAGSCANSGTYTNTWIAKDVCLNTSTVFTQTINIIDNTVPTWTTSANALNTTLQCSDATGLAAAQNQAPVATDNCGGTVTYIKTSGAFTPGSCANSGTYTNTWIAKDVCLNTSTVFTQTITIIDNTVPTWTTSANSLNTTLQCSDAAGLTAAQNQAPVATDNCGGIVTYTKTNGQFQRGSCGSTGTYTNTWTAKDICNNISTVFTQVITIKDTEIPTWITQAGSLNKTLECSDTMGLTAAQNLAPVANANCSIVTYIKTGGQFVPSPSCANAGTYTNTWVAKDDCGNITDTFTQVITIQDTTKPTWTTTLASLNKTIECSNAAALTSAQALFPTATDSCDSDVSDIVKVSGVFVASADCSNAGTYTNTWTVKDDCGNTSDIFTQVITIQDTSKPTWTTTIASLNKTIECSDAASLTSAQALFPTASDSCDSDVSDIVKVSGVFVASADCSNAGTYTNTWTVKDDCGNTSDTFTQVITIQDTTKPTWTTTIASLNKTIECSDAASLTSAQALFPTATDSCDSDVSNIVKVSGAFAASADCLNAGTYTNTWTVKDDCGNTSDTFTQVITIQDTTKPIWSTQIASLNKTIECSDSAALTSAQALFPTATDSCDGDVSNIVKVSGAFAASADCSNAGTYTNTWTVKDDCGNTSDTFTQVITIQDSTKPIWSTQIASLNKTIECSDAAALTSAQALFPTATDSCDSDVSNIVKVSGAFAASADCLNAGTYTNTWTVKDDCGNTSDTFTQVITIQDTTKPVFIGELPSDITVSCDAVPAPETVEASDNCNSDLPIVFNETKSNIDTNCANNYTLTRKWTTSDCGGNTASITQIITVRDTTAPTGTAPVDVANLQSIADIPVGSPSDIKDAADNCSSTVNITVTDSNNGGSGCEGNAYILTRTYTLTDCAGNKTELKQIFTVENKVSVNGVATNTTCFGGNDGSILVTNSPGSTVVIRNANNEIVENTNLPAGTYTLTATSAVNTGNQTCSATATVVISQPAYTVKISGQILNKDSNTPLANVPVTLVPQGTTTGPILLRITGADGFYSFSGMVAGSYLVQVQDANLNSAHQLYPIDSSLFFTTLEDCKVQQHNFEYGASTLPVLGDYVWYDTNNNGVQDEWYDANNDGVVTKNIPDGNGAIDYSKWEWIDLNGDGSYAGPSNVGELNAGGFGNALTPNVIIDGPNGYHEEVIVGIEGFWRNRPDAANPYGSYTIKLVKDANFNAVAASLGATGLVKVLPSVTDKKVTAKAGKSQLHTVCTTTGGASGYIVIVTPEDLVHLDADFGVNCKVYSDIIANDDTAGPIAGVNVTIPNVLNVLNNDTLEGVIVKASDVIITTVTPNDFLHLNADGSIDVLPNAPVGTLTLAYQICEADQTDNCDTATVTITIEAPVMTVTATAICVNDVPYVDYVVTPKNFTPANGVTIAWTNSSNTAIVTMNNLPLTGRVLWPGAVVDGNGKGIDWPGWIFENNKWVEAADGFETLRPAVKLVISVNPTETITVNYPPADPYCTARPTFAIVANDDNAGPIIANNGQTNVLNVLTNDSLNGNPVVINDVTLTIVTPDSKGALTLNPDGSIDIKANTPAGTYTLTYQICEKADFGNCDTAIVTIIVADPPAPPTPVVANDDTYANIGCNTFGLVGNVLSNDLKGITPATLILVNFTLLAQNNNAKTDPNITIDASGNVTVSSLTPAGTYTYSYQICDKLSSENCDTATVTIIVVPNGVTTITGNACNDDSTLINLLSLLPENTPTNGTWVDASNTNSIQGNSFNPLGLTLGNYVFEYKITNQTCPTSIILNMEINDDCKVLACGNVIVHNAFSPNGDGINDVFVIDSIDDTTCYPENNVEIYNRWGILVFETNNYNNTTNAFDGTSRGRTTIKQSDGLPTGTYFYIITYKSLDGNNVIQNNKKDGYLYLSK